MMFFVETSPAANLLYQGSYDSILVALSMAVAVFASYAALLVAQHGSVPDKFGLKRLWVAVAGLCLGAGLWAMHFVGMLAFSLPCGTSYDPTLTMLSMVPGVLASIAAVAAIDRAENSSARLTIAGALLTLGISGMHFSGMAAMRFAGMVRFNLGLFLFSAVLATTLWILVLRAQTLQRSPVGRGIGAVVMGLAASGMHYSAMASTYFVRADALPSSSAVAPSFLASVVLVVACAIIIAALVANFLSKPIAAPLAVPYRSVTAIVLAWSVAAWLVSDKYTAMREETAYRQGIETARQRAATVADNINYEIGVLGGVADLLSKNGETQALLRRMAGRTAPSGDAARRREEWTADAALATAGHSLANVSASLGLNAVYLLNEAGKCVAASNAGTATSFVGTDFADRDYYRQPRAGKPGFQYAFGRITKVAGLFTSHEVADDSGRLIGVVVVKRDISGFLHFIRQTDAFVADANGVIVLSEDGRLLMHALPHALALHMPAKISEQQYGQPKFLPAKIVAWDDERFPGLVRIAAGKDPVALATKATGAGGLTVNVPVPLPEIRRVEAERVWLFVLLAIAGDMAIAAAAAIVMYLRADQQARKAIEDRARQLVDSNAELARSAQALTRQIQGRLAAEAALREREQRLSLLTTNAPDMIWRNSPYGRIIDVSGACEAMIGYSAAELTNHQLREFIHPDDLRAVREFSARIEASTCRQSVVGRLVHKDGHHIWAESTAQVLRDENGCIVEIIAISRDITTRREDERRLRLAATMFEATQEGIMITDARGRIIAVNPAFCAITGYDEPELIARNPRILRSGHHNRQFYREIFDTIAADGYWQGELWNRRKSGEIFPDWLTITAIRDEHGKVANYIGTFIDISRVKESERQLEHLAHHDPLTDLPNRLLLLSRLQHAVELARREETKGAVLFLDLDRFKNVNDSLGHASGDQLLRMVAARYLTRLRESDTLCRVGGDEFVVLLENLREPEHAAAVAQSLIDELGEPFKLADGHDVYVGASIGISVFPDDTDDPDKLISYADAAMYQAKNGGRNSFRFYTETMTRAVNERVELESSLRRALDNDEFVLHYQPLVAMADGRITGVEALVRWRRPGIGHVPPADFIPLAEETGLIIPLGDHILRTACRQMRLWLDGGLGLETMAVNLSAHQFKRPDLHASVRAVLEETGLPAGRLELEITETALLESAEEVEGRLRALKELGVRLAIDDFGTGYSSLSYLKRFPIDKLKVDRTFVCDIPGDSADMEIVAAIISLAKNLRLEVLAEGVETEAQMECLRTLKCDACQGYLFSQPLPSDDFARFFGNWSRKAGQKAGDH